MQEDVSLSAEQFEKFSELITDQFGIKMPVGKKRMLESRLKKRLHALQMKDFNSYYSFVFSQKGKLEELPLLADAVSTNKTDFFREPYHFEFLRKHVIRPNNDKKINVWSSACSSGEEPYSIAIQFEKSKKVYPELSYRIYCSDISDDILNKARAGIFDNEKLSPLSLNERSAYFDKLSSDKYQVKEPIRKRLSFNNINLIDIRTIPPFTFDVIFCRNVMIYFSKETQEKVMKGLSKFLKPDGYLIIGHSENLNVPKSEFKTVHSTIFQKI